MVSMERERRRAREWEYAGAIRFMKKFAKFVLLNLIFCSSVGVNPSTREFPQGAFLGSGGWGAEKFLEQPQKCLTPNLGKLIW